MCVNFSEGRKKDNLHISHNDSDKYRRPLSGVFFDDFHMYVLLGSKHSKLLIDDWDASKWFMPITLLQKY